MSEDGRWDIPDSWEWARAKEFAKVVGGGTPANAKDEGNYAADEIPWITPADLSGYKGTYIASGRRNLSRSGFRSSSARLMPRGSVLLSSRAPVGYCAIAANEICTNQGFKSFVVEGEGIAPEFLRYYLLASKRYLQDESSGTTFLELSGARAEELLFPIAPSAEQKRIVSKIDELLSSIEQAAGALERARKLVERYRQSVLKAAVTGELTREWREQHANQLESGEALLTRTLKKRREAWEASELAKMRAKYQKPPNDAWKNRYQEPLPPNLERLPELPDGWTWASIDQLTTKITSGSRDWKEFYGRGSGVFVMAQNVRMGSLDLSEVQLVDPPQGNRDAERSKIERNDLLVTIVGANTGDVCRVPEIGPNHFVCQSVALLRPVDGGTAPLLENFLTAQEGGQKQFERFIYGAGRPHLSFDDLRSVCVPLPGLEEQNAIADMIAKVDSEIADLRGLLSASVRRAEAQRQSILKAAFSGELVAQDSTDEPASLLLKRIAVERAASAYTPRTPR